MIMARNTRTLYFLILLVSLNILSTLLLPYQTYAAENALRSQDEKVTLRFLYTPPKSGLKGAEGRILIKAPPEKVWNLLDNQEKLGTIVPGIKRTKVLEKGQDYQKDMICLSTVPLLPVFKYTLLLDESNKYKEIRFKKISGCFKQLYGTWKFEPYNQDTILVYTMYIDFGFNMPSFLRVYGLNNTLPHTLKAIKSAVEK
jgi:ribosome-associated toxin RatA of RatAB toxin-antitoxin module